MVNNNLKSLSSVLVICFISFSVCDVLSKDDKNIREQQISNLRVFTKLYGYVRFFHPSDQASKINWDKFAVYGIEKIRDAENNAELKKILNQLFLSLAPTAQIYEANESTKNTSEYFPKDTTGLKIIAWQHYGVQLSEKSNIYKSMRLNRGQASSQSIGEPDFGVITQAVDAAEYRGKEIKLKAFVKCDVAKNEGSGHLWLRVDQENKKVGFFDNMKNHHITLGKWRDYEINGVVDNDAEKIVFGSFLKGYGKLWVDDFQIFIRDNLRDWQPIEIKNPGFESSDENNKPLSWLTKSPGYNYTLDTLEKFEGNQSLSIEKKSDNTVKKIFDKYPKFGEIIEEELIPGLFCRIPLALYSDDNSTLGTNDQFHFDSLNNDLSKVNIDYLNTNSENARLADIIIAWNVLQHFYPYFDVVKVDWNDVLAETLKEVLSNKTDEDFYDSLRKMVAKLQDGHGYVYYYKNKSTGGLPIRVEWIENNIVVTASKDTNSFKKGDIIKSIDGKSGLEELLDEEKYVSGSPQLKRFRALNTYGSGQINSIVKLELLRDNKIINLEYNRNKEERNSFFNQITEFEFSPLKKLKDDVYYINVNSVSNKQIFDSLKQFLGAKGIIFDERFSGKMIVNNDSFKPSEFIPYLIDTTIYSTWWNTPQIIYPDRKEVTFQQSRWTINPEGQKIKAKIIFINDPSVVSYGESYMGIFEHYKLAEFVGEPTAGCNGNVNYIPLLGGFEIMFTGMKVCKHDGSQLFMKGILPTYAVDKTIKAVKEGKDEYLEKAIEVINNK